MNRDIERFQMQKKVCVLMKAFVYQYALCLNYMQRAKSTSFENSKRSLNSREQCPYFQLSGYRSIPPAIIGCF
jgi:hypothetical protein